MAENWLADHDEIQAARKERNALVLGSPPRGGMQQRQYLSPVAAARRINDDDDDDDDEEDQYYPMEGETAGGLHEQIGNNELEEEGYLQLFEKGKEGKEGEFLLQPPPPPPIEDWESAVQRRVNEYLQKKEWLRVVDAASGKAYFYHGKTRQTTWDLEAVVAKELEMAGRVMKPKNVSPNDGRQRQFLKQASTSVTSPRGASVKKSIPGGRGKSNPSPVLTSPRQPMTKSMATTSPRGSSGTILNNKKEKKNVQPASVQDNKANASPKQPGQSKTPTRQVSPRVGKTKKDADAPRALTPVQTRSTPQVRPPSSSVRSSRLQKGETPLKIGPMLQEEQVNDVTTPQESSNKVVPSRQQQFPEEVAQKNAEASSVQHTNSKSSPAVGISSPPAKKNSSSALLLDAKIAAAKHKEAERKRQIWRQRVIDLYQQYNPSKSLVVDELLQRYQGREEELWRNLKAKYSSRAATPTPRAATPRGQQYFVGGEGKSPSGGRTAPPSMVHNAPSPESAEQHHYHMHPQRTSQDVQDHLPPNPLHFSIERSLSGPHQAMHPHNPHSADTHSASYHTTPPKSPTVDIIEHQLSPVEDHVPMRNNDVSPTKGSTPPLGKNTSPSPPPQQQQQKKLNITKIKNYKNVKSRVKEFMVSPLEQQPQEGIQHVDAELVAVGHGMMKKVSPRGGNIQDGENENEMTRDIIGDPFQEEVCVDEICSPDPKPAAVENFSAAAGKVVQKEGIQKPPKKKSLSPGQARGGSSTKTCGHKSPVILGGLYRGVYPSHPDKKRTPSPDPNLELRTSPPQPSERELKNRNDDEADGENAMGEKTEVLSDHRGGGNPQEDEQGVGLTALDGTLGGVKYTIIGKLPSPRPQQAQGVVSPTRDGSTPKSITPTRALSVEKEERRLQAERKAQRILAKGNQKLGNQKPIWNKRQPKVTPTKKKTTPAHHHEEVADRFNQTPQPQKSYVHTSSKISQRNGTTEAPVDRSQSSGGSSPNVTTRYSSKNYPSPQVRHDFTRDSEWVQELQRRDEEALYRRAYLAEEKHRAYERRQQELQRKAEELRQIREEEKKLKLHQKIQLLELELNERRLQRTNSTGGGEQGGEGGYLDPEAAFTTSNILAAKRQQTARSRSGNRAAIQQKVLHPHEFSASSPMYSSCWTVDHAIIEESPSDAAFQQRLSDKHKKHQVLSKEELQKSAQRLQHHYSSPVAKQIAHHHLKKEANS